MSAGNEFYHALYYWQYKLHCFWCQVAIAALVAVVNETASLAYDRTQICACHLHEVVLVPIGD